MRLELKEHSVVKFFKKYLFTLNVITTLILIFFFFFPNIVTVDKPEVNFGRNHRDQIIGKWLGETHTQNFGKRYWLYDFQPDGKFKVSFLLEPLIGKVEIFDETGVWGSSGSVFFTITREFYEYGEGDSRKPISKWLFDSSSKSLDDAYQIDKLTENELQYTSLETGHKYTAKRVKFDFVFEDE